MITGLAPTPIFCITIGLAAVPVAVTVIFPVKFSVYPAGTFKVTPPAPTPCKFKSVTKALILA